MAFQISTDAVASLSELGNPGDGRESIATSWYVLNAPVLQSKPIFSLFLIKSAQLQGQTQKRIFLPPSTSSFLPHVIQTEGVFSFYLDYIVQTEGLFGMYVCMYVCDIQYAFCTGFSL